MLAEKKRAFFFDRDGVLNVDTGFVHLPSQFQWVPGAMEAIGYVKRLGYYAVVVTNQSGVARGYYGEDDVRALHDWMNDQLMSSGCAIDAFYHCPFYPNAAVEKYSAANHPDRKPNPGMLQKGIEKFDLQPELCFMIGDRESDMEAARRAGVKGCLFQTGNLLKTVRKLVSSAPAA